jgi:hypothetical protein
VGIRYAVEQDFLFCLGPPDERNPREIGGFIFLAPSRLKMRISGQTWQTCRRPALGVGPKASIIPQRE